MVFPGLHARSPLAMVIPLAAHARARVAIRAVSVVTSKHKPCSSRRRCERRSDDSPTGPAGDVCSDGFDHCRGRGQPLELRLAARGRRRPHQEGRVRGEPSRALTKDGGRFVPACKGARHRRRTVRAPHVEMASGGERRSALSHSLSWPAFQRSVHEPQRRVPRSCWRAQRAPTRHRVPRSAGPTCGRRARDPRPHRRRSP
jgi:hypothetical protein